VSPPSTGPTDPERGCAGRGLGREAGIDGELDLLDLRGTGESRARDWAASIAAALDALPDHLSAYALVVERDQAGARVDRGELPMPEDDDEPRSTRRVDSSVRRLGWAVRDQQRGAQAEEDALRSKNLGYWSDGDWWGIGPGDPATSGGVRCVGTSSTQRVRRAPGRGGHPARRTHERC